MNTINILLVDDHAMVREGLKVALNSNNNLKVIGEASNGRDAINMIAENFPDVVLMDINMPEMDGLTTAKEIKKLNKKIKIIILTMLENELYVIDALKNNIEGFIYKDASLNELLIAIEKVSNGGRYFNKEISDKIMDHIASNGNKNSNSTSSETILTSRQIDIIKLISKGFTSREVAEKLYLSELTVIKHRKNIIKKLGLKNFTEVVSYSHRKKII